MQNLNKARAQLIMDHPFFASLFLSMPLIEDTTIKTLCTNGDEIRYNPAFVQELSVSEALFTLGHETLHCVLQHMTRRGSRNANRWNQAADYLINEQMINEGIGTMPKGCLYDPALVAQSNGTTESIYDLLPEESEGKGAGEPGGAMDEVQDAAPDQAGQAQKEADMRVRVVQAAMAAKQAGKLSDGMARMVKEMTKSRVDWKAVLRRFFTERAKTDYSYARPKRRFLAEDIYLPSLLGEQVGEVVFAMDVSLSITDEILKKFAGEMQAICEDIKPLKFHVIYFNAQVARHDVYENAQDFKLEEAETGGTAFQPVFDYIEEKQIQPVGVVFLTDLYGDNPQDPGYPVLWASIGKQEAAFGEVVEIRE